MSMGISNKNAPEFSLISITDIVFLLTMFFILISTYVVPGGIKIKLPSSKVKDTEKALVSLSITSGGEFFINSEKVLGDSLEAKIIANPDIRKTNSFVIKADKDAPAWAIVKAFEVAYTHNLSTVLATNKPKNT